MNFYADYQRLDRDGFDAQTANYEALVNSVQELNNLPQSPCVPNHEIGVLPSGDCVFELLNATRRSFVLIVGKDGEVDCTHFKTANRIGELSDRY